MINNSISGSDINTYLFKNYHVIITNNDQTVKYTVDDLMSFFNTYNKVVPQYLNVCKKLASVGYMIDPRVAVDKKLLGQLINDIIPEIDVNYNSTFYKSWLDLISKTDTELLIDQLCHYLSTYGTNYTGEHAYVPNAVPKEVKTVFDRYTVIKLVTVADQAKKFIEILSTPVALSDDNISCMINVIKMYFDNCFVNGINIKDVINIINNIKNKEAKIVLAKMYSVPLTDPSDMVRLISYIVLDKSNIVLSKDYLLQFNNVLINYPFVRDMLSKLFNNMTNDELKTLSQVYHRYHKLFELIHHTGNKSIRNIINKLSRYAKKNHKPMVVGYWENILSKTACEEFINKYKNVKSPAFELYNKMKEDTKSGKFSCFKAIKLYNTTMERLNNTMYSFYYIRNNKMFVKDRKQITDEAQIKAYGFIRDATLYYVIKHFREYLLDNNIKYIVMPDKAKITYALPTSEKNFIGSVPMFSFLDLSEDNHNMVGIYWRNKWGTYDFDISAINSAFEKIGWNSYYRDSSHNILYSGDMTDADPEATEIIYFNGCELKDSWFFCNRYNGNQGSKFRLFFSQEHADNKFEKNYMVDPKNILFSVDMKSEKREQALGCIVDNKFVFTNINVGDSNVSNGSEYKRMAMTYIRESINDRFNLNILFPFIDDICKVITVSEYNKMKELENTDDKKSTYNVLDLDFCNLTKDTFIKMFS